MSVLIVGKKEYHDDGSIPEDIDWSKGVRAPVRAGIQDAVCIRLDDELAKAYESVEEIESALLEYLRRARPRIDKRRRLADAVRSAFRSKLAQRLAAAQDVAAALYLDKDLADQFTSVAEVRDALREYAQLPAKRRRTA